MSTGQIFDYFSESFWVHECCSMDLFSYKLYITDDVYWSNTLKDQNLCGFTYLTLFFYALIAVFHEYNKTYKSQYKMNL